VFGLYRICGMQYAPRLADLTDARFWRTTQAADYGVLSDLARHRVRLDRVRQHWPQMLRIGGSLVTGTVRAYDLIRASYLPLKKSWSGRGQTVVLAAGRWPAWGHPAATVIRCRL
jgi:TnpA family transposase